MSRGALFNVHARTRSQANEHSRKRNRFDDFFCTKLMMSSPFTRRNILFSFIARVQARRNALGTVSGINRLGL
jgi:hypothetical protein